ncbi:MAG: SRPBCC family protein [Galactobacter sp.]
MPLLALASDTESLRVEWVVPAQPDRLWSCLTEDAALSQWLGGLVQGHVGPGRSFVVDHGEGICSSSTVLECTAGVSIRCAL